MTHKINRRDALRTSAAFGAALWLGRSGRAAESPSEKLNLALVGVGGRGADNVGGLASQNFVAFADVDDSRAGKTFEKHPGVRRYRDWRKMFDEVGSKVDAVVISTPDHTHFHPAYAAMQLGLHVYLEKPLAHNLWETRTLCDLAREKKLATQLGAQRHAMSNMHRVVELVKSGAIGKVTEVHSWIGGTRGMPDVPTDTPPVPPHLDWELWIGPAKYRPYHPSICPYGWRFWWDYGTAETGNWGCHILDIPYWALDLKYPTKVEASGPPVDPERTPKAMAVHYEFPARGDQPPVKLHWYHADKGPDILRELKLSEKGNNTLFIGSEGMLLCGFDRRELLPKEKFGQYKGPEPFIPDSPGFYKEWIAACKGGEPATCNFEYSGPMAETVLLGNLAYRFGGFDWDAKALKPVGNPKAEAMIREAYRQGWSV
ncbi:MAG: Gfo/Idh/MocA family oxidoreductase [Thermoguttaceae bacterium]|nr:Gfo/Idh/MocA family oxidoreductase [Thermoguttaceae bacterium]